MDLGLEGKRALVLASSQGLGLGIAVRLADEGARVVLTGRSADKLAAAVAEINARHGDRAAFVVTDLSDTSGYEAFLATAEAKFGAFDVLVNNTGGPPPGLPSAIDMAAWEASFRAMVLPVAEITRRLVTGMRSRGWGRVITVASSGVVQPIPNLPISNALRASLLGWLKTLSAEVAPDGVTVNMVLPGRIATARTEAIDKGAASRTGKSLDEVVQGALANIPAGRYGTVAEFAAVVAFLAGQPSSYVTGSVIRVDGGLIKSV